MSRLAALAIAIIATASTGLGAQKSPVFRVHYGDDFVPGIEIAGAANVPAKNAKAAAVIFIPDAVRVVRAVVVLVERAPRSPMSAQGRFGNSAWRQMVVGCQCALLFFRLDTIRPIDVNTPVDANVLRNAAAGGGDVLVKLMEVLASESSHPELARAPFVFWGWSASANFGTTFAEQHPERTAAVIRYHTHLREHKADIDVLSRTPVLLLAGEKDEAAGVEDAETLWKAGRRRGAAWTFAIEPGATHGDEQILMSSQQLMLPWIIAVVSQRVPTDAGRLRTLSDSAAWLGDQRGFAITPAASFTGTKAEVSWLPDEAAAKGWRVVSGVR